MENSDQPKRHQRKTERDIRTKVKKNAESDDPITERSKVAGPQMRVSHMHGPEDDAFTVDYQGGQLRRSEGGSGRRAGKAVARIICLLLTFALLAFSAVA